MIKSNVTTNIQDLNFLDSSLEYRNPQCNEAFSDASAKHVLTVIYIVDVLNNQQMWMESYNQGGPQNL